TLKMPAFEWVHVQLHQQKGMISLSPPTICNSAQRGTGGHGLQALPSTCSACRRCVAGFGEILQIPVAHSPAIPFPALP
ncbi:hypothetical protein ACRWTE_23575, partial [Escherichia coli]